MKRITLLIFLILPFVSVAQTSEQVVRKYVQFLNEWLESQYDASKKDSLIDILSGGDGGSCIMKDEIVEKYNSESGDDYCLRDTYLSILSEQNRIQKISVKIITIEVQPQYDKDIVKVQLEYSGGISLTTTSDFYVYIHGKIGQIVKTGLIIDENKINKSERDKNDDVTKEAPPTKTYLILRINEPNAKVEINGKAYDLLDKEFNEELDYGTYDIYVSKPNFQMEYLQITLNDKKPVIKDVILRQKNRYGSLIVKIKGRYGANIYLDNNLINSGKIYSGLYGSHNLRLTCGNKTKDKTINIKPNKNVVKKYRFVNPYGGDNDNSFFIGGRYSLKSTIGLSLGYGKKFGAIVNLGISPYAIDRMQNNKKFADNFTLKSIYPSVLLDFEQRQNTSEKGSCRMYLHLGPMYRPYDWFAFYATVGFGNHAAAKEYNGHLFAQKIHKGIEGEAGVMFKYKRLALSLGYQRDTRRESRFQDVAAGLYVWLGK